VGAVLAACTVMVAACGSDSDGGGGDGPVKGYRVIVVADCTGTDTDEEQNYAETYIFPKIGQVMTSGEFLSAVG
jgi:hypothetical protein